MTLTFRSHLSLALTVIDTGVAAMIASSKVKVKQGVELARFTANSVIYTDGTDQEADDVIYA